jgi:hypothetical protein
MAAGRQANVALANCGTLQLIRVNAPLARPRALLGRLSFSPGQGMRNTEGYLLAPGDPE